MLKKIGAATAVLALIAAALTFTNMFVTRDVLASEIQAVYQTMEVRDLERAQRDLYSKHLELTVLLAQATSPALREALVRKLNEIEAQRQLLDNDMDTLLKHRPSGD